MKLSDALELWNPAVQPRFTTFLEGLINEEKEEKTIEQTNSKISEVQNGESRG